MECSFSLFIPFRFHIHREAGPIILWAATDLYSLLAGKMRELKKKRTRIPWLRSLRWGLLMRPIYRGFWTRREIVILFRRTWRGVNWHKKTSFVFFSFPWFLLISLLATGSRRKKHFFVWFFLERRRRTLLEIQGKSRVDFALKAAGGRTRSLSLCLSVVLGLYLYVYIYTHNTRLGPLPRSLSYMEPLGYPDKLLFRRGRPARRGIRLMKQWKSPQSAHGPAKGPIAGAQGAAKVPKQQHPLLSEKKVAAAATASLLTDIYTVVLHGKEKKPPILTKSDQMREKNFSGSFFPPFSFKEEGPFF